MTNLLEHTYNPDVLSCIANLSNDEVFTPPEIANRMLDLLPSKIWSDPNIRIIDPVCKSGIFLREAAKRFIEGLQDEFPDLEERVDHILKKQLYGIAITELTSLLSRRSVYCSIYPNSRYSVVRFEDPEGNIRYRKCEHTWHAGKCECCGASRKEFERKDDLEQYAYEFIHFKNIKKALDMRFDVVIGNPPYQLQVNKAGKGLGAIPIYQKFVEQAMKLSPRYLSMIIPARWFSGGVGLDDFRKEMLSSGKLSKIVDYTDSKECFPGVDVNGGICYFLWQPDYDGMCEFTNITQGIESTKWRKLNEFDIFIRRNEAMSIVKKVVEKQEKTLSDSGGCSPQTPYGLLSTFKGASVRSKENNLAVLSSKGWMYAPKESITKSKDTIDQYKTMISKLSCEHAGNPDKSGKYRVLSRMELLQPNEICTQSYLIVCPSNSREIALNVYNYLRTKFVRFLILQTLAGMNISISNFKFVPWQDFSKSWTDEELYAKYNISQEEQAYIDSLIKDMDGTEADND